MATTKKNRQNVTYHGVNCDERTKDILAIVQEREDTINKLSQRLDQLEQVLITFVDRHGRLELKDESEI